MKQKIIVILLSSMVGFSTVNALADVWSEREALSKVEHELESLKVLILAAQSQRDPKSRTTFNYQVLLSDVDKIRAGISTHLNGRMEPVVPSTIDALKSDYTEHNL